MCLDLKKLSNLDTYTETNPEILKGTATKDV
jgi:hypothetical protein